MPHSQIRHHYLTQERIISNAERSQREHVAEALRRYAESEYRRDEQLRIWRGVAWGLVLTAAVCGFFVWLILGRL
jgi:hypothetical protein